MKIVCATDFSPSAKRAAEVGLELAKRFRGSLALVHVVDAPVPSDLPVTARPVILQRPEILQKAEAALAQEADRLSEQAPIEERGVEISIAALFGPAVESILGWIEANGGDLVVAGQHGRAAGVRWFGSTVTRLARLSSVPVMVVREHTLLSIPLRVLVGVDLDRSFTGVMPIVRQLQATGPVRVDYVHVDEPVMMPLGDPIAFPVVVPEETSEPIEEVDEGAPVERVLGRADLELPRIASERGIDLIAIGTHGRHGLDRALMGSVAGAVLRRAACAVLVAHAPELALESREAPPPAP